MGEISRLLLGGKRQSEAAMTLLSLGTRQHSHNSASSPAAPKTQGGLSLGLLGGAGG